jgi:AraC-like DNA-binding protein/mannose-6-phosphate isomerase-like protein (cupin superfamily)
MANMAKPKTRTIRTQEARSARSTNYHRFQTLQNRYAETVTSSVPLLVWQDAISGPERQTANHHLDFCSLYVVRKGRGNHVIEGTAYAISRGDVYAMGPGMSHYFEHCDSLITDTLHFLPSLIDSEALNALSETSGFHSLFVSEPLGQSGSEAIFPRDRREQRWLHLTPTQYTTVQTALVELHQEWQAGTSLGALLTRGLFIRLLAQLSRFHAENSGRSPESKVTVFPSTYSGLHESTVAAAIRYMEEHYSEPLRVEQVAASVFLSPDRFTEVFAQGMGRTPRDYLRHLRVEQAKMLLATTDLPMAQIAEASGFGEAAYFTRVVRAATGMTPSAYRHQNRGANVLKP